MLRSGMVDRRALLMTNVRPALWSGMILIHFAIMSATVVLVHLVLTSRRIAAVSSSLIVSAPVIGNSRQREAQDQAECGCS